jgi:hypothetical protein
VHAHAGRSSAGRAELARGLRGSPAAGRGELARGLRAARSRPRDAPGKGDGWGPPGRRPCVNGGVSEMSRWWKRRGNETNRYVCKEWQVGNYVTQKQTKAGSEMLSSL